MFALEKNSYRFVAPIFEDTTNSKPVVFSVIDGNTDGKIFVDDNIEPKSALVQLHDMFFLKGEMNLIFCEEIFNLLISEILPAMDEEYFAFYCLSDELRADVEKIFSSLIHGKPLRKTFTFDQYRFDQYKKRQKNLPKAYTMNISSNPISAKLIHNGEVISECFAVFVGAGQMEISVATNEKYRRQGFASLTCSAFIEECLAAGYIPNWTCWSFREGSTELAKKLGFVELRDEVVYGLKK